MDGMFDFGVAEVPGLATLRQEVRDFLGEERRRGTFDDPEIRQTRFDPAFSKRLAARGWIGMTWPKRYGGGERSALERHIVTEELLAAGAPVRAHWVADRQSGPLLLRFGTEVQRGRVLPRIAAGELSFCIGMSEPDSGSDLASIRTRGRQVEGGWRVSGTKLWTSNAHRVQMMILFARTGERGESRHEGVSQFLVELSTPGITVRPVVNMAGHHDFNEVVLDDVFIPDEMVIGTIGNGWNQVTSELVYERSGPDRWLSSYRLLADAVDRVEEGRDADVALGRLVAQLWTLQAMSQGVAGLMQSSRQPQVEAAVVKDLGTGFEQEIPEVVRRLVPEARRAALPPEDTFHSDLANMLLNAPSWSIRGGTREVLRGIIARGLGLR
jgi:alkylation response protein AidB-like acyl-CoA dehydrogenase